MTGADSTSAPTAAGVRAAIAGTDVHPVVPVGPEGCHDATAARSVVRSAIAGRPAAWVFGLEAQGNWADFKGSNVSLFLRGFQPLQDRRVRPVHRPGRLRLNNALFYVKGGAAVTQDRWRDLPHGAAGSRCPPGFIAARGSGARWGGVVSVGAESGFTPRLVPLRRYEYDCLVHGSAAMPACIRSFDPAFAARR